MLLRVGSHRGTQQQEQPKTPKIPTPLLIMSDCLSALKLVERAWRAKHREEYAGSTRGAILEAICTASERIELAVFMYVPAAAHRGLAPNAIADAVAKAYTQAPHTTPGVSAMMQEGIRRRRVVHVCTRCSSGKGNAARGKYGTHGRS